MRKLQPHMRKTVFLIVEALIETSILDLESGILIKDNDGVKNTDISCHYDLNIDIFYVI